MSLFKLPSADTCCGGLSEFVIQHFYGGELVDTTAVEATDSNGNQSYQLHPSAQAARKYLEVLTPELDVTVNLTLYNIQKSRAVQVEGSHSWKNLAHAQFVMLQVKAMLQDPLLKGMKIQIIAMYRDQVEVYHGLISQLDPKQYDLRRLHNPKTVNGSRGDNFDIVCLDFVRSHGIGYMGEVEPLHEGGTHGIGYTAEGELLNVALSRPRYMLLVFANVDGMVPADEDRKNRIRPNNKHLCDYFDYCKSKGRMMEVSLCRSCGSPDHMMEQCSIAPCKECGSTTHSSRACPRKPSYCVNCKMAGHLKTECPICGICHSSEHKKPTCPGRVCQNCAEFGHDAHECKNLGFLPARQCKKCAGLDHLLKDCPMSLIAAKRSKNDPEYMVKMTELVSARRAERRCKLMELQKAGPDGNGYANQADTATQVGENGGLGDDGGDGFGETGGNGGNNGFGGDGFGVEGGFANGGGGDGGFDANTTALVGAPGVPDC